MTVRATVYYALFPLGVFCECWILMVCARRVGFGLAVPMILMLVVHAIGNLPPAKEEGLWLVAAVDVFVVKTGDIFRDPKVRAWIPVADGSHAF